MEALSRGNDRASLTLGSTSSELAEGMQILVWDCQTGLCLGRGMKNKFCTMEQTSLRQDTECWKTENGKKCG